jgi:hypothetical protein
LSTQARPFALQTSQIYSKNGGGGIRTLVGGKPPETVFETVLGETVMPQSLALGG